MNTAYAMRTLFYMNNCVCSLKHIHEWNKFILEAQKFMSAKKFNLREQQSYASLKFFGGLENQIISFIRTELKLAGRYFILKC